jgi:secreted PhoX family phosphatase
MDLPKGFSYEILSVAGARMDDGWTVPALHDGTAAFPGPDGLTVLVRNHEMAHGVPLHDAFGAGTARLSRSARALIYDNGFGQPAPGGTTTLVYDTKNRRLVSHFLSLAGTVRNCAGGATPWGTWITCEESLQPVDERHEKDHGYCFEVPASPEPRLHKADPIRAMGRFNHEAIAVDPASGVVYLTEDRPDGLLYRFLPDEPGRMMAGGRLQALRVRGARQTDTRNWERSTMRPGDRLVVEWVDLKEVDSPDDSLRIQGFEQQGCARFARGEGMWYGNDAVYFACTNGGSERQGQIFKYTPSPQEGRPEEQSQPAILELFIEPNDMNLLNNADNLTVSPWGDLVVCEDGSEDQFLIGVTPAGQVYRLGRNASNFSELTGCCFSPDGTTLFVNIQDPGLTLAISGPWKSRT